MHIDKINLYKECLRVSDCNDCRKKMECDIFMDEYAVPPVTMENIIYDKNGYNSITGGFKSRYLFFKYAREHGVNAKIRKINGEYFLSGIEFVFPEDLKKYIDRCNNEENGNSEN